MRHHVLCHLLAETNAGVVALRDDVRQAIVDVKLDLDVGIERQELRRCRPQDRLFGVVCTENSNSDVVMVKPAEDRV
jgi:hypothetical protein